jgi:hypothetical protein
VSLIKVTDWLCPVHWAGETRQVEDGTAFVCGGCPNAEDCVSNGCCERLEDDPDREEHTA